MADKVTTTTDFQDLWKKFFDSIKDDSTPEKTKNEYTSNLSDALFKEFNRAGIDFNTKRDLINRGIIKILFNLQSRKLWGDRLLQLKEKVGNGHVYGFHQFCPVYKNDDAFVYQLFYADACKESIDGNIAIQSPSLSPLYQVESNGRTVTSDETIAGLSKLRIFNDVMKEKLVLQFQTQVGSVWVTTQTVPTNEDILFTNADGSEEKSINADLLNDKEGEKQVIIGSMVVKYGNITYAMSENERLVISRGADILLHNPTMDSQGIELINACILADEGHSLDSTIATDNNSSWLLYGKQPQKTFEIYDNTEPGSAVDVNLDGKTISLSFIPAVYNVTAPSRNNCIVQRLIGNTWYDDDTIAIQLDELDMIESIEGATFRIDSSQYKFFGRFVKDKSSSLMIPETELQIEKNLVLKGPISLRKSNNSQIIINKNTRIAFNRDFTDAQIGRVYCVQRFNGETWSEDAEIRLEELKRIVPNDGATYCVDNGEFQPLERVISISIPKGKTDEDTVKQLPTFILDKISIHQDERLEILGPIKLYKASGTIIELSKKERIVINRNKVPSLQVLKASQEQPIGRILTNYFMGMLNHTLSEMRREKVFSFEYNDIDNETYQRWNTFSTKTKKRSGLEKGISRDIYRIPTNEDEINRLSYKDIVLLYCLNLTMEEVNKLLDKSNDRQLIDFLSSIPNNLNLFEFLEWYSLVIQSEEGNSGESFYPLLQSKLSNDHPDKVKDTNNYSKLRNKYFRSLNKLIVAKFPSLKRTKQTGISYIKWHFDDSIKITLNEIRNTWIENLNSSEKTKNIEQDDKS